MKQLLVMRHGKSDWGAGLPDHERTINDRGVRSAVGMGRVLDDAGLVPDRLVSSTAVRARTTAEHVVRSAGWDLDIEQDERLYESDVPTSLAVVEGTDPDVDRLMIVGHQPTWGSLVNRLTGGNVAMRTATVAVLDLHVGDWAEVASAHGEVVAVLQPRHLVDDA